MSLVRVQNVEALIITRYHSDTPATLPVVATYLAGARSVQSQVSLSGQLNYTSWEQAGQSDAWPELQVSRYPTIIFIDLDTNKQITRLTGAQITAEAVANTIVEINRLQRDPAGNYFDADGNWLADTDSGAIFTAPWGLGVFNINLSPIAWLFGGLLLFLAVKR